MSYTCTPYTLNSSLEVKNPKRSYMDSHISMDGSIFAVVELNKTYIKAGASLYFAVINNSSIYCIDGQTYTGLVSLIGFHQPRAKTVEDCQAFKNAILSAVRRHKNAFDIAQSIDPHVTVSGFGSFFAIQDEMSAVHNSIDSIINKSKEQGDINDFRYHYINHRGENDYSTEASMSKDIQELRRALHQMTQAQKNNFDDVKKMTLLEFAQHKDTIAVKSKYAQHKNLMQVWHCDADYDDPREECGLKAVMTLSNPTLNIKVHLGMNLISGAEESYMQMYSAPKHKLDYRVDECNFSYSRRNQIIWGFMNDMGAAVELNNDQTLESLKIEMKDIMDLNKLLQNFWNSLN